MRRTIDAAPCAIRPRSRLLVGAPVAAAVWLLAPPASALDAFEIQVYDGTANAPRVPGLELHLNDWATGQRNGASPEAPLHGQFHATLEPSIGVLPFWELGAYLQFAERADDGVFGWAGVKLRSKFVTPPDWDRHVRLGVNIELSYVEAVYEASRWESELRPIAAWHDDRWLFVVNPILDQAFAAPDGRRGPIFAPAAKAARTIGPVAVGLEYYGEIGPLVAPLKAREQAHYVYGVIDIVGIDRIELNAGVGEGLTPASAGLVVKLIVGYEFEAPATSPAPRASYPRRLAL